MLKYIKILFLFILFSVSILCFVCHKEIYFILFNERFDRKVYCSPNKNNFITVLIHTVGYFDGTTDAYIIPGEYFKNRIPETDNYVKFHDGSGFYIDWNKNDIVQIFAESSPIYNSFKANSYRVKIVQDRRIIKALISDGKKIIRYSFDE